MKKKIIPIVLLALVFVLSLTGKVSSQEAADLKKITSNKEDVKSLKQALDLYKNQIAQNPQNYELKVQGADLVYYLVIQTTEKAQKKSYLAQGIDWSKQAIALNPKGAGGHFFYGILTGLNVQMSDFFTALKSKDIIRDEMLKVIELDPAYAEGDAYIALGQWYAAVPFFMGGSDEKAKEYLMKAVERGPTRAKPHLALAEFYSKRLKYDVAKKEIDLVLSTPLDSRYVFENKRDQAEARVLLNKIETRLSQPARGYDRVGSHPSPPGS